MAIGLGTPAAHPLGQGGAVYNAGPTLNASGVVVPPGGVLSVADSTFNGNAAQQERQGYGTDGYDVIGDVQAMPSYANLSFSFGSPYLWAYGTDDPRALQKAEPGTDRIPATEFADRPPVPLTLDVNLTDGKPHTVSLYLLDYDSTARSVQIQVLKGGVILDTRNVTSFHNGVYVSWVVQGRSSSRSRRCRKAMRWFRASSSTPPQRA